jgi:EAL domain-containing protein (putative c-di-GMP-specific phosphodiesterase class I)
MYAAKSNGKRGYALFEPEMHARVTRRQELASALERAVARDEIDVHFQPIVALSDGSVVAFEALARWRHPDQGLLPASTFIPIAEETGATTAIARVVLRAACRQTAAWQKAFGDPALAVSVNLGAPELQDDRLIAEIDMILGEAGIKPQQLILEITESTALRDPDATSKRLHEMRSLGIKLALDDFGTGYSSLSYLRDFPIDYIKIPKPFIDALDSDSPDETLVRAVLQIAEALELQVIAEGIESERQAAILSRLDCSLAQGYNFSPPVSADEAVAYLRSTNQQRWRVAQRRRRVYRGREAAAQAQADAEVTAQLTGPDEQARVAGDATVLKRTASSP